MQRDFLTDVQQVRNLLYNKKIEENSYRWSRLAINRICISPSALNIVRKEITYIRNQMQRDFLTMYNRLEIAVL